MKHLTKQFNFILTLLFLSVVITGCYEEGEDDANGSLPLADAVSGDTDTDTAIPGAPIISMSSTNISIEEGLATGTQLGTVVVDDTGDGPVTEFKITGDGVDDFELTITGVLKTNKSIVYNTKSSYTLFITAINDTGVSNKLTINITVTELAIKTVPQLAYLYPFVDENLAKGTFLGQIKVVSGGGSTISSFDITEATTSAECAYTNPGDCADTSLFAIDNTGNVTVAGNLDYETKTKHYMQVTATNGTGTSDPVSLRVSLTNLSEGVPVITGFIDGTIPEGSASNTVVKSITINDSGDTAITVITLTGANSADFSITNAGQIKVAGMIDFETKPNYSLTAVATNAAGDSNQATVAISVTDVTEAVPVITDYTKTIAEELTIGTQIDPISINTNGEALTAVTLGGTNNDLFNVDLLGGVTIAKRINFEDIATNPIVLTIDATNSIGDATQKTATITITDKVFVKKATFAPTDLNEKDRFGWRTSIDGDYMSVGSYGYDNDTLSGAYVYKKNSSFSVSQIAKFMPDTGVTSGEFFGFATEILGDYVFVSAPKENANGDDSGAVYVYKNNGSDVYAKTQKIIGAEAGTQLGYAMSVDGLYLAVTAPHGLDSSKQAVYIYKRNGSGQYIEVDKVTGKAEADLFGYMAVEIQGDYLVVGAGADADAGAFYTYKKQGDDTFRQIAFLTGDDTVTGDRFGRAVALSGDGTYIAVNAASTQKTYIFKNDGSDNITQVSKIDLGRRTMQDEGLNFYGNDILIPTTHKLAIVTNFENPVEIDSMYFGEQVLGGSINSSGVMVQCGIRANGVMGECHLFAHDN